MMATELPKIGRPAINALQSIGIMTLEEVAEYERTSILDIHGVGAKAIDRLDKALKEQGLSFKNEKLSEIPFELVGDLACDNAPKRRIMLDFLLASALADKTKLSQTVVSNFTWKVPGAFELKNLDEFYNEIETHTTDIKKIEVTHNLTHGKFGAMHGIQTNVNGINIYFADFIEFESHSKNAKIKTVTSYVIMNESQEGVY